MKLQKTLLTIALLLSCCVGVLAADGNLLGLEPEIVSIKNVEIVPVGDYKFRAQFEVEYSGADLVYVSIKEEGDSKLNERNYREPNIAHIVTNEMYIFYYHWIDVIVQNEYGTATKTLEIPDLKNVNDYFIRLSNVEYQYTFKTPTWAEGLFSFDVLTNYPGQLLVNIKALGAKLPWNVKCPIVEHPVYQRFRFEHNIMHGSKMMVSIPGQSVQSEILEVNNYMSQEDRDKLSGVEDVSYAADQDFKVEGNTLKFPANLLMETVAVEVMDMNGRVIRRYYGEASAVELDLTDIAHGIYIIKVMMGQKQIIKKIAI